MQARETTLTSKSATSVNLRQITTKPIRLEWLLIFWVLAVLLPALAIFASLNYIARSNSESRKLQISEAMLDALELLNKTCNPVEYFKTQILLAEKAGGLPERDGSFTIDQQSLNSAPEKLHSIFCNQKGIDLLLLMTAEQDPTKTRIFTDNTRAPDFARPGLRVVREIQREFRNSQCHGQQQANEKTNPKILKSFLKSVFGTYIDPVHDDEDFITGFSENNGMNRFMVSRRLILNGSGKPAFSYIALFRESESTLPPGLSLARKALAHTGFKIKLKIGRAKPFPFIFTDKNENLVLTGPVDFSSLISGYMTQADIASHLLKRGIMSCSPAVYPHFEITADIGRLNIWSNQAQSDFFIFLFLCASLLLLKNFHQQGNMRVSIRARLFISVVLAMALPVSIYIFYFHRYLNRNSIQRQLEMKQYLKNHLQQLEFSVQSGDQTLSKKLREFVKKIEKVAFSPNEKELSLQLKNGLGKTLHGASLCRNDGLIVEHLAYDRAGAKKLESNIGFVRVFTFSLAIKFFDVMGLKTDTFQQKILSNTAQGRKLLSLSELISVVDLNNFCENEGSPKASRQDFGNFRLQSSTFLPSGNKRGAILLLLQDVRDLAHIIVDDLSRQWSFFRHQSSEGTIETTVISCFDAECRKPDFSKTWPPHEKYSESAIKVLNKLMHGFNEAEFQTDGKDGSPVVTSGRKISGYPLIAVAQCRMETLGRQKSQTIAIIGGNIVYILLLLIVLVKILSDILSPPIDSLLTAATLTGEGNSVRIANDFDNELSQLTVEFNSMNAQIKERERLERFISHGAAQAIVAESNEQKEVLSRKAHCTIVFIHIKKFGDIHDSLSPEKLFSLLNLYFPFAEELITAEGGQIDKYIGDAIMAVFFPESGQAASNAHRACKSARNLVLQLPDLNFSLTTNGLPEIELGIGISTGEAIIGLVGSKHGRLDYTAIGDRVNLAARLEAASHNAVRSQILADENTWVNVRDHLASSFHGEIKIKGKALPVSTYEIIA